MNPRPDSEHASGVLRNITDHLSREYDIPPPGHTVKRGFPHIPCLLCGRKGSLAVVLSDTRRIRCLRCGEEISVEAVKGVLGVWVDVVDWLEKAPICSEVMG